MRHPKLGLDNVLAYPGARGSTITGKLKQIVRFLYQQPISTVYGGKDGNPTGRIPYYLCKATLPNDTGYIHLMLHK